MNDEDLTNKMKIKTRLHLKDSSTNWRELHWCHLSTRLYYKTKTPHYFCSVVSVNPVSGHRIFSHQLYMFTLAQILCTISSFLCICTRILQSAETGTCPLWRDWRKVTYYLCRLVRVRHTHTWEVVRPHRGSRRMTFLVVRKKIPVSSWREVGLSLMLQWTL